MLIDYLEKNAVLALKYDLPIHFFSLFHKDAITLANTSDR